MILYQKGNALVAGRLSKDAAFRVAGSRQSHFTSLSVPASERDGETIWVDISCAFEVADATRNLKKGDRILAAGTVETRTYTGRDGEERQSTQLKADIVLKMTEPLEVGDLVKNYPGVVQDTGNQFADLDDEDDGELPF